MGKEASYNKLKCMSCKDVDIERIADYFSSNSDPQFDRVLQTIVCNKCGWTGVAIFRLELVYTGDDNVG